MYTGKVNALYVFMLHTQTLESKISCLRNSDDCPLWVCAGVRWGNRKRSLPSGLELTFQLFPAQLYGPQRQQKWIFPGASFSTGHRSLECLEIPAGAPLKHWGKCYSTAQRCPPQSQTQFGLWEMVRMSLSLGKSQCMATDFQTALLGVRVGEWEWGGVTIHFPYVFICREKSSLIYICKVWKPMHQLLLNYLLPLKVYHLSIQRSTQVHRPAAASSTGSL